MPSFDGALKPNQALETRRDVCSNAPRPRIWRRDGADVYLADGAGLRPHRRRRRHPTIREFDRPITALACLPGGGIAVALDGARSPRLSPIPRRRARARPSLARACAASTRWRRPAAKRCYATDGSATRDVDDWAWDLMERGRTRPRACGSTSTDRRQSPLAAASRYAFGACAMDGRRSVSRKLAPSADRGRAERRRAGRAGRICRSIPRGCRRPPAAATGSRPSSPARQLVEFVLREAGLSPAHDGGDRSGITGSRRGCARAQSFKEPMQGAHLKTMGVVKPWAPPRSYGLVDPARRRWHAALFAAQPRRRQQPRRSSRRSSQRRRLYDGQGAGTRAALPSGGARRRRLRHERHHSCAEQGDQALCAACRRSRTSISTCGRGEIHALVGENGAGKSTLTKVMAGVVHADVRARCRSTASTVAPSTPLEARHLGIAMVFQENSLVPTMTVAQNLFLGQENFYNRLRGIYIAAQQFLQSLNFDVASDRDGGRARRRQEADGGDRARRAAQRQGHHLRRADRVADAGGEEILLRPGARPEAARRLDHLHLARARRGAAAVRPHHRAARRQARGDRRRGELRPRADHPGDGRARPVQHALRRAQDDGPHRPASACCRCRTCTWRRW